MLKNLKKNYFLLISTFFIFYFFFSFMSGERGFISYLEKTEILNDLRIKEENLIKNLDVLEFRNSLLSDNLDLDYVETLIRERFIFGKESEKIYIIK